MTLLCAFWLRRHDLRSLFLPTMHAISLTLFMWAGVMCMGMYDG
jgi:hypothetical protein